MIPQLAPTGPSAGPAMLIEVSGSRARLSDIPEGRPAGGESVLFVGTIDGRHCWARIEEDGSGDGSVAPFTDLMSLHASVGEDTWLAAGRAVQLADWLRNHRYCGHCGAKTEMSEHERSKRCPECGLVVFPRLAPAIIVLIEREDGRALLARNARWPTAMYSCLAGFVEPGESAEAALRREVFEEVGIEVGALRYFGSQPWPFPHSLMLGFHADYAGGEITCDEEEISDAEWFSADDLPGIPGPISVARRLIDDWVKRQETP